MHEITLVCSAHRENGFCNAVQLLRILQRLAPEVVFEETRPCDLNSTWSLECKAIAKYRERHVFQQVPVDRYDIPANLLETLRAEIDRVFDCVEQTSEEYLALKDESGRNVYSHGFEYLNSPAFAAMTAKLSDIKNETISRTHDQRLIRGLEAWRVVTQSREREMVRNIYGYCRENVFHNGVFLIGAAHQSGIVRELARHAGSEGVQITWRFVYHDQTSEGAS